MLLSFVRSAGVTEHQPAGAAGARTGHTANEMSGLTLGQITAQAALSSFEIDLFGRLRAQNAAATERYLASREGQVRSAADRDRRGRRGLSGGAAG